MTKGKQPIQAKITRAILLTSTIVLLVTGSAYFAYEFFTFRETAVDRMAVLGEVIAYNSTAALAFDSKEEAYDLLLALRGQEHIVAAALYDEHGELFSKYPKEFQNELLPGRVVRDGYYFDNFYLHGFIPVILGEHRIGTFYMMYNLKVLSRQFLVFGAIVLSVFILSLLLAWLLSSKLQERISQPIIDLANIAHGISENKDYSVRVVKQSEDEIGVLTDAFNHMLTQIQEQSVALQKSEKRFRTIADNIAQLAWMTDETGAITWYNQRWYDYTGASFKDVGGWGWKKLHHPHHVDRVVEKFSIAIKSGDIWEDTFPLRGIDGNYRWFLSRAIPIRNESGEILHWFGTNTDVSELMEVEEALRLSEEFSRTLFESSPDCVIALDIEGEILSMNPQGLKMLDINDFDQYHGRHVRFLWHEEYSDMVLDTIGKAQNGRIAHFQCSSDTGRIGVRWWDVLIAPIYGTEEHVERLIAVSRDITKLKELEQQKDDFIGIASHELKTPVTSIKAYAELLQNRLKNSDDELAEEMLVKMDAQINRLNNLITDLLDVTRIEQGKLQFREEYFDFNELVRDVTELVQRTSRRHRIETDLDETRLILGDRDRLGQVITNYLTNAIKYSPRADSIIVRTEVRGSELIFSVKDFGLGLAPEDIPRVFERFFRVGDPGHETYPGLGLGLYISAGIIHRQNGKTWVASEKGKGSTFYFSLPLETHVSSRNTKSILE
ncbi:hypothetical protein C900_03089 [Fulvivirga imtechensis AK7]|uniref:histidine kinase n=1 Tax=Fulvivirga imtechensis AK7 TaxID=1237149 RepID=L8JQJ0_9BACT|nr:PAS domain S-box protein [Fulvivirga imtechensis]ELR71125.1 hypothetical protein C900_03089 [Fulvivirga imtechensis AK7]